MRVQAHRKPHLEPVPVPPGAVQHVVARRRGEALERATVERDAVLPGGPVRHAHPQREPRRPRGVHRQRRPVAGGEGGLLRHAHALLAPVHLGRDEQIDPEPRVVVEVDAVAELGERLAHRPGAAPVVLGRRAEQLPQPRRERDVVQLLAVRRVLAAEDAVEQRALVVVGDGRVGGPAEQVARELQHVVGGAVLLRVAGELRREHVGIGLPPFAVGRAAGGVGAVPRDLAPEVLGDPPIALVARQLVAARGADHLRDVGVAVQALQLVAPLGQRREEALVVEAVREPAIALVSGDGGEVVEHLVHPAVLALEDALHLVVAQAAASSPRSSAPSPGAPSSACAFPES